MDLEDINCPQYVRFSSESFQDSLLNYDTSSSENVAGSLNQISVIEGDVSLAEEEISSSVAPSEEEFVVHTRATRSEASNIKKDVTVPKPFCFKTDSRLKNKDAISSGKEEKDFASQLRQHEVPHATTCGVTKVKAFNLTESKNKKGKGSYVPLAEQIKAFQKTPDRYHSSANKEFQPQAHWSPPKLRPRTPKLQAVKRHRTINVLSREELEEQELEKIKAYEFHAHPVDPRVYKPDMIVKMKGKESIKSRSFDLKTAQRAAAERLITQEPQTSYEFRARPIPKSILLGPTGLGEKPEVKITHPISPAFCTRKRLEKRKLMEEQEDANSPAKKGKIEPKLTSKSMLSQAKKSKPKPKFVRPVPTKIKPFSFDQADKQRFTLKEKKISEEIEKENKPFIFKAQPLPSPSASMLPKVEKKPPTQPEPFNFILDTRSFHHDTTLKENSVSFKAQPATVLKKEPFIPEKLQKHTTEFKEFDLNTDRRASERLKLLEQKEAEEREKEQIRLARKALDEEKERQEILKLRQELVHKANPVRQYKVVEIKHSSKQLTEPISPQFETDKRSKVKKNA